MAMREMTSRVGSSPAPLVRQVNELKAKQDDATARMGSDMVGVFGTADPDFIGFVTDTFKGMKPVTVPSGNSSYGTIALLPDQQHATLEDRYYSPGTAFVMDRAGSSVVGQNILRGGPPPAGYYGGDKLVVQKRLSTNFRAEGSGVDFTSAYTLEVDSHPNGYALQTDERLDGSFYPGSTYLGLDQPFGWTFPSNNGRLYFNSDPFTAAGWSGSLNTVPDNPATKPVISSLSQSSFDLGSAGVMLTITGSNFLDCGWVLIGPFQPTISVFAPRDPTNVPTGDPLETKLVTVDPNGAYYYRAVNVDGTEIQISLPPPDAVAGTYDVLVVGNDGQIARMENAFTFTGEL